MIFSAVTTAIEWCGDSDSLWGISAEPQQKAGLESWVMISAICFLCLHRGMILVEEAEWCVLCRKWNRNFAL
jgi:hypothetical protein